MHMFSWIRFCINYHKVSRQHNKAGRNRGRVRKGTSPNIKSSLGWVYFDGKVFGKYTLRFVAYFHKLKTLKVLISGELIFVRPHFDEILFLWTIFVRTYFHNFDENREICENHKNSKIYTKLSLNEIWPSVQYSFEHKKHLQILNLKYWTSVDSMQNLVAYSDSFQRQFSNLLLAQIEYAHY